MAVAGTLAVNIIAQTKKFQDGIKKARTSLAGFTKQTMGARRMLSGFGATMIGLGGTAGFAAFARRQIEVAATLGEVSAKLGVATEDLELMRFAAEQTGSSVQTLDLGLQRMVKRVGQAAAGGGEAAKTFKRLGLDAKTLVELDPAEQFERISAAIRELPTKSDQLRDFASIFDSEAVSLLNMAVRGINSFVRSFNQAGGATASRGVRNAQEFSKAAQEFSRAIGATGRDFVLGITPAALDAVKGLQVIMQNLGPRKPLTAFEETVQAKRGTAPGSDFDVENLRRAAATGIGEVIAAGFASDPRARGPKGSRMFGGTQGRVPGASNAIVNGVWDFANSFMMMQNAGATAGALRGMQMGTKPF